MGFMGWMLGTGGRDQYILFVETGRDKNEFRTEKGRGSFPTEFCSRYSTPPPRQISCEPSYKGKKRPQKW